MVVAVKTSYRFTFRRKRKRLKKAAKGPAFPSLSQRYFELRRLRQQVSEAESRVDAR